MSVIFLVDGLPEIYPGTASRGLVRGQVTVKSPTPRRIPLDLLRAMRTRYQIDSFQQSYFMIESFQQLFDMTAPDFTPLYEKLKTLEELPSDAVQEGEP
jgi:phenylalanine-4-hydroxylase